MDETNPFDFDALQEQIDAMRQLLEEMLAQCARGETPDLSLDEIDAITAKMQRAGQLLKAATETITGTVVNLDNDAPPA